MALFGDPSGDRKEAAALVAELAVQFGTPALFPQSVTREAFARAANGSDIIHFQGHAQHNGLAPLSSCLVLANKEEFSAEDIFALPNLRAELVVLAACESAKTAVASGDEPDGLIPSFLVAGANTVLASMWKVEDSAAARVMRGFYDPLISAIGSDAGFALVQKVDALRRTAMEMRQSPRFSQPYHWAAFVLHGDWE